MLKSILNYKSTFGYIPFVSKGIRPHPYLNAMTEQEFGQLKESSTSGFFYPKVPVIDPKAFAETYKTSGYDKTSLKRRITALPFALVSLVIAVGAAALPIILCGCVALLPANTLIPCAYLLMRTIQGLFYSRCALLGLEKRGLSGALDCTIKLIIRDITSCKNGLLRQGYLILKAFQLAKHWVRIPFSDEMKTLHTIQRIQLEMATLILGMEKIEQTYKDKDKDDLRIAYTEYKEKNDPEVFKKAIDTLYRDEFSGWEDNSKIKPQDVMDFFHEKLSKVFPENSERKEALTLFYKKFRDRFPNNFKQLALYTKCKLQHPHSNARIDGHAIFHHVMFLNRGMWDLLNVRHSFFNEFMFHISLKETLKIVELFRKEGNDDYYEMKSPFAHIALAVETYFVSILLRDKTIKSNLLEAALSLKTKIILPKVLRNLIIEKLIISIFSEINEENVLNLDTFAHRFSQLKNASTPQTVKKDDSLVLDK